MKVAVVGATGLVGQTLLPFLLKDGITNLTLISSKADEIINYGSYSLETKTLSETIFNNIDVAFFCVDEQLAKKWIPIALKKKCLIIDNSSAYRLEKDVPLVVPEINNFLIPKHGIVANPNCSTIILSILLNVFSTLDIETVNVSTYQAVSGAGKAGMKQLEKEIKSYPVKCENKVFNVPILNNCFVHDSEIDLETGYNKEELKMIKETKKILNLDISATCIRVPVYTCHTESVTIKFSNQVSFETVKNMLQDNNDIVVIDDKDKHIFPTPLTTANTLKISVGHIRKDYYDPTKFHFVICGDQLLKGAAYNAFQIFKHWKTI